MSQLQYANNKPHRFTRRSCHSDIVPSSATALDSSTCTIRFQFQPCSFLRRLALLVCQIFESLAMRMSRLAYMNDVKASLGGLRQLPCSVSSST